MSNDLERLKIANNLNNSSNYFKNISIQLEKKKSRTITFDFVLNIFCKNY